MKKCESPDNGAIHRRCTAGHTRRSVQSPLVVPVSYTHLDVYKRQMQKIQAKMDKHVKNVDVYDVLMQHRTEYDYFRTDQDVYKRQPVGNHIRSL